jgi:hypothetical protein
MCGAADWRLGQHRLVGRIEDRLKLGHCNPFAVYVKRTPFM